MKLFVYASTMFFLIACGKGTDFKSITGTKADQKKAEEAAPAEEPVAEAEAAPIEYPPEELKVDTIEVNTENPLDEDAVFALSECAKKWDPPPPFTPEELANPEVINIAEGIQNSTVVYENTEQTKKAKLYLINYDVKNANQGTMKVSNEFGWYCVNIIAKVINNFKVETSCGAKAAIVAKNAQNDNKFEVVNNDGCVK